LGFTLGLSGPIAAWIADVTNPKEIATAMGLFRTAGDLGFVIGPIVLAALAGSDTGMVGMVPFLLAGLLVSGSAILLLKAKDPIGEMRQKERAWRREHED
jgi:MFS family permease